MKFKSRVACEMSISSLTAGFSSCYLWTFTTADVIDPRECARRWNDLQRYLVRFGFFGVRVFELHPGGHGLHVHALTVRRFDINKIRSYSTVCSFGRINVKRIPVSRSCYIAKYLSKQFVEEHPELKGIRLWARVGVKNSPWSGTRVCDVEAHSDVHACFLSLWESVPLAQRKFQLSRKLWLASLLSCCKLAVINKRFFGSQVSFRVSFIHPRTGLPLYSVKVPSFFGVFS